MARQLRQGTGPAKLNEPSLKTALAEGMNTMLSARNQFKGTVKSVKLGGIMAEIVVAVGDFEVVSAITRASVEAMNLKQGDVVNAIIKSTEVIIEK